MGSHMNIWLVKVLEMLMVFGSAQGRDRLDLPNTDKSSLEALKISGYEGCYYSCYCEYYHGYFGNLGVKV